MSNGCFNCGKRPLSVLFTLAGRTAAILDVAINVICYAQKRLRSAKQGNHLPAFSIPINMSIQLIKKLARC